MKRDGFREQNIKLKEDLREKNMDNATVVRERNQAQASLNSERQNREQKELWIREAETKKHESKRLELEAQIKQLKNQLKEDHDELLAEKRKREDDAKRVVSQAVSASTCFLVSLTDTPLGFGRQHRVLYKRAISKYASINSW